MVGKTRVLALIPARGGSKGIPRKNIRLLGGVPLIAYSIAAGKQAVSIDRVIVSTDDEEIAAVARAYGAETPFLRPEAYARDETTDLPVFQHALEWLRQHEGYTPEIVVQLRPTSPFRPAGMVDEAVQILIAQTNADSVRGVVPSGQNPYKMWRIAENGQMVPLLTSEFEEPYNMPRQKLPPTFWQTGHIDAVRSAVIQDGSMSGKLIFPLQIDPRYTVDLDNLLDWEQAEARLKDPELLIVRPDQTLQEIQLTPWPEIWGSLPFITNRTSPRRSLPDKIDLLVLDFDGVMTDDRVYVDENGVEMVAAHRGDGMGIAMLKKAGIPVIVLSTETNPVVSARAKKLGIPAYQGVGRKGEVLSALLVEQGIDPQSVVYVGNDINDLPCFPLVGCAVVVANAHPKAMEEADIILTTNGGDGAVRELIDIILAQRGGLGHVR